MKTRFTTLQRNVIIACMMLYSTAYLNRLNLSAALGSVMESLSLNPTRAGILPSAFAITYAAGQMVNGALVLNRPFNLKKHAVRCGFLLLGVYVWYLITMVLGHAWKSGFGYVAANWRGILMSAQYLYEYDGIGTSHLWFVHMMVAVYLLVPLIRAAFDSADVQIQKGLLFFLGAMGIFSFLLQHSPSESLLPKNRVIVHEPLPVSFLTFASVY